MKITAEFNSLEEVNEFAARIMIGGIKKTEEAVPEKTKQVKETKKTEKKISEPAETEDTGEAEDTEKKYTLIEVRAALAKIAKTDTKRVAAILNEFGAEKLSDIKEEDYAAVMERAGE